MSTPRFLADLAGTLLSRFKVGKGTAGLYWKVVSGGWFARNAADSADAPVTASRLSASGDSIDLNSDATEAGADWMLTLSRPPTGMTADLELKLPPEDGSPGDYLGTDGAGNLAFYAIPGGATNILGIDETDIVHGDSSPVAMFTKPAGALIPLITVHVDTAFNGTNPTLSIGPSGTPSKYVGTTDVDLKTVGQYEINPGVPLDAGSEAILATYSSDGSSAGALRIITQYGVPN